MTSVAVKGTRVWSTREACEVAGLPISPTNGSSTLAHRLCARGVVNPIGVAGGSGTGIRWSAGDVADLVLAVAVRDVAGPSARRRSWLPLAARIVAAWRIAGRPAGWVAGSDHGVHVGLDSLAAVRVVEADPGPWLLIPAVTPDDLVSPATTPPPDVEAGPPVASTQATPGGAESRPAPSGDRPPTVDEMGGAFEGGPDSVEWLREQRDPP